MFRSSAHTGYCILALIKLASFRLIALGSFSPVPTLPAGQRKGTALTPVPRCVLCCRQGIVTDAMLAIPKGPFLLIGACEAAAAVMMMAGAAHLPGALLPLLMQANLVWNILFSAVVLHNK